MSLEICYHSNKPLQRRLNLIQNISEKLYCHWKLYIYRWIIIFTFLDVNVHGEYGATPLHYAARYTFKPSKTPGITPMDTPLASPTVRKSNKGLMKNLISNRRLSGVRKEDLPKRAKADGNSPFQRSLRNLLGRAIINNKKSQHEIPLVPKLETQTIHPSLEKMETNHLIPTDSEFSQTQSSLELRSLFKRNQTPSDSLCSSKPSLDLNISETPVVIVGDSSKDVSDDVMSIDALIIPEIKHMTSSEEMSPSLKSSKSLPDIGDEASATRKDATVVERNGAVKVDTNTRFKVVNLLDVPETRRLKEESILIYLLEQKANVNAKDFYGSTPLHFASMRGNVIAAHHLLNVKSIDIEVCLLPCIISCFFLFLFFNQNLTFEFHLLKFNLFK